MLIDSRTGITDVGDICTVILPDILVPLFVSNRQNIEGVKNIVARAREARQALPVDRTQLLVIPIPSRKENAEYDEYARWENLVSEELGNLFADWLPKEVDPADALRRLSIPYVPKWSFGERLPVIEGKRELSDPASIGAAFGRIGGLIESDLDWKPTEMTAEVGSVKLRSDYLVLKEREISFIKQLAETRQLTRRRVMLAATGGVTASLMTGLAVIAVQRAEAPKSQSYDVGGAAVHDANCSPDGRRVVAALSDTTAGVWDISLGMRILRLEGHRGPLHGVAYSPGGAQIATASIDGTVRIWRAETGIEIIAISGMSARVNSVAYSPDGTRIVTASTDGICRSWAVTDGRQLGSWHHKDAVMDAVYSPDGTRIATVTIDGTC